MEIHSAVSPLNDLQSSSIRIANPPNPQIKAASLKLVVS